MEKDGNEAGKSRRKKNMGHDSSQSRHALD